MRRLFGRHVRLRCHHRCVLNRRSVRRRRRRDVRRAATQPCLAANLGTATKSASRLGACTPRDAAAQPGGHSAARTGMGPYARTTGCAQGGGLRIGMPAQGGAVTTQDAAPAASPEAQARTAGCAGLTANSHTAQRA